MQTMFQKRLKRETDSKHPLKLFESPVRGTRRLCGELMYILAEKR